MSALLVACVALFGVALIPAGPAFAAGGTCNVGMYPNIPAALSNLKVACVFTSTGASSSTTVTDYPDATWHYGAARTVKGNTVSASNTITITSLPPAAAAIGTTCPATATAGCDINHSIEGPGIPPGDFITAYNTSTHVATFGPANTTAASTGGTFTISNNSNRGVKDGVTNTGTCGSAVTVCSATAHFTAQDVGKTISGGSLKNGSTIATFISATKVTVAPAQTPAAGTALSLTVGPILTTSTARSLLDASWTSGGTTITSATGQFDKSDIGLVVAPGPGQTGLTAPPYFITGVASATSATINHATTAASTANKQTIIGLPTKTAPANGDEMVHLNAEISLNPSLVAGQPPCSAGKFQGFSIPATWHNPGSYVTTAPAGALNFDVQGQPTNSIAQLNFQTTSTSFSGFVVAGSPYKVVFGFIPTTLALCPNTSEGADFGFEGGLTASQALLPSGTGGGTTGVRFIKDELAGNHTYTANVTTGAGATNQPTVTSSCTIVSPAALNFSCGQG